MNRRERKKKETRDNIIGCAVSLFKEKGFQETLMEEIAENSDVSKGTLYNYFQDKESILVGYFQVVIANYGMESLENLKDKKDVKTRLYNLMDYVNNIFKSDMELAVIYFRYRMHIGFAQHLVDDANRSGIEKLVNEIIEEAQINGELRTDIPSIVLTRSFQLLAMSFFISNIFSSEPIEIDIIKNQLIELFLNGAKL